jgi:hypothetical protein
MLNTQKNNEDDECPLELANESGEKAIPEWEGLPKEYKYHDEDEAGDYDLDGLYCD